MPTQSVTSSCAGHLQDIADVFAKAKKVVVVTGAGISTNLGIPDFRSEHGLYALIQAQYDAAAAAEKEKVEKEESRKPSTLQSVKSRSSSPNQAGTPPLTTTTKGSTRPFEPFTIKTRSTTTIEAQDARIFTRSRSDLTPTWSRRQTLDNPDTLLRRTSSITSRTQLARQNSSSIPRESEPPINTTNNSSAASSQQPSLKRARSLEVISNNLERRTSKRIKLLYNPSSTLSESSDTSKDPSPESSSQASITTTTRAVLPKLKGKDLFDSMVWQDPLTTAIFLTFIAQLRKQIRTEVIGTSKTHKLIKALRDGGRLVRCYTQNVDGLERREGLNTSISSGTGRRSRFFSAIVTKPRTDDGGGGVNDGGVEVVQLHGGLDALRCSLCGEQSPWERGPPQKAAGGASEGAQGSDDDDDQSDREEILRGGRAPGCQRCIRADEARQHRGRRSVAVGKLRPDVVLYGEEHPEATRIGELVTHDLSLGPDIILIMGTSLRVHGLKVMVREFARAAHAKGGKVVFVNNTKPPESTWGDVLDYWVEMDCDRWVEDLKERRGELWLPQGLPVEPNKSNEESSNRRANGVGKPDSSTMPARGMPKSAPTSKTNQLSDPKPSAKRPQCQREDEMNGAYWAYQIQLNLEIIGGRPRTYAPNCNPYRKWGHEKWRRDSGKFNSASAGTSASSALKSISTNVPRPVKGGRGKVQESDDTGGGAGSQLQRELSASVGPPVSRSGLLLPTPPPSDETEAPEGEAGSETAVATPKTRERIKVASSIERILSSPVGKKY